uniref:Smr domain-containing protein n=1 Tax=Peronospora matthiolae TaxID=2874970 RepID=A0AAV1TKN9_9STRA
MQLLETWATARLEALGVDRVFAPYIVSMLPSPTNNDEDCIEDAKRNIHEVLMGWLAPEDEECVQEFVDELVQLAANAVQLTDAATALTVQCNGNGSRAKDDIHQMVDQGEELKASAPTFVPRQLLSPAVAEFHPTTTRLEAGSGRDVQTMPLSLSPIDASTTRLQSRKVDEKTGTDDGEQVDDEQDGDDDAMQNEDSFFWSVAYELVSHLQLKFQDIDPDRMCELLRLVGLDVDKAHAVLKVTIERESVGPSQVCRHYMQGDCRRADCMFLHDTDSITCRFWLRGTCLQAEHCVFAHDFCEYYSMDEDALGRRDYDSEDESDQSSAFLDIQAEDMFPSLQSVSKAPFAARQPQGNGDTMSSDFAIDAYPSTSDVVANLTMNFARAVSLQPRHAGVNPGSGNGSNGMHSKRQLPPPPSTHRLLYHKAGSSEGIGTKWLSTGEAVATQYLKLREQAYGMACARNKCFMGATQAYRSGNKALARGLSRQGREYNTKMKHLHFLAASEIFESRNPPSQLYMDRMMDLHGLHVAEAVEFLSQMLPKLADEGVDSIYLVTGSGHHSKGPDGNARLLPAVERFLVGEGYQFSRVADGAGFVGMLLVDLQW